MGKKKIEGIELEVSNMITELELMVTNVIVRINGLEKYKYSGSVEPGEIENLEIAGEAIRKNQENPTNKLLRDYFQDENCQNLKNCGKIELYRLKAQLDKSKIQIEILQQTLDEHEEKFCKYNVPKRLGKPLDQYVEKLLEFMNVTWKSQAQIYREKENRTLIEWMQRLDQSNEQRKISFDSLKTVLSDLGIKISKFLIDYFLLSMVVYDDEKKLISTCLYEAEIVLRCLSTGEENSVVINTFVSLVKFFENTMRIAGALSGDTKEKGKKKINIKEIDDLFNHELEDDLFRLIIIEVLRLEVSFCYPDLPMMVIDEVFLAMGRHLVDNVFEDKFNRVSAKIDELKMEFRSLQDDNSSVSNFIEQIMDTGIKELWNELDLRPAGDESSCFFLSKIE